jgi:hypothetical protein
MDIDDYDVEIIEKRLLYLSDAVDRLNKTDWYGIAISTLIGISINLSLDTEKGRLLFKLFKQVVENTIILLK